MHESSRDSRYENGFSPEDVKVLAVDDNVVCLTLLTALLNKCRYQVTSTGTKSEALALLRQNLDRFDIVLTNVNMDEMDGFKLIEAGLELDIPVIIISASESRDIIMNGIRHGAVDYLIKPVRLEAIQTIWRHVYRKKLSSFAKDVILDDYIEDTQVDLGTTSKDPKRFCKRKNAVSDQDNENQTSAKRDRIKWSQQLHTKFLDAVHTLGGPDKAVPKKILDLMNEPNVTREKVASHLQKYRRYLKKNLDREIGKKMEDNKHQFHHQHSPPASMHQLSNCIVEPSMGLPTSFNQMDTIRRSLYGRSSYPQEINNTVCESQPLQIVQNPMEMQQSPMLNFGNIMGSSSNYFSEQPVPQLPRNSADLRYQAPEEVFDHGPDPLLYDYQFDNCFDVNTFAPFG